MVPARWHGSPRRSRGRIGPAYTGEAAALSEQGRFDEAEAVLRAGLDRDAGSGELLAALERLAVAKENARPPPR